MLMIQHILIVNILQTELFQIRLSIINMMDIKESISKYRLLVLFKKEKSIQDLKTIFGQQILLK